MSTPEALHKLLELADTSDDCQYGTLSTSTVRDLVNEALAALRQGAQPAGERYRVFTDGPPSGYCAHPAAKFTIGPTTDQRNWLCPHCRSMWTTYPTDEERKAGNV